MNTERFVSLTCRLMRMPMVVVCLAFPPDIYAQGSSADFNPNNHDTSAVDAKGVRHHGREYAGNPPWLNDLLKSVASEYPYEDRRLRHQGRGIIRLTLDLKTGVVTKATVIKSTGFSTLDSCAVASAQRWTWKPGKWKEIDLPIIFHIGNTPAALPGRVKTAR
jgi:TonB family protein